MADMYESAQFEDVLREKQAEVEELLKMALPKEEDFQKSSGLQPIDKIQLLRCNHIAALLRLYIYHLATNHAIDAGLTG